MVLAICVHQTRSEFCYIEDTPESFEYFSPLFTVTNKQCSLSSCARLYLYHVKHIYCFCDALCVQDAVAFLQQTVHSSGAKFWTSLRF